MTTVGGHEKHRPGEGETALLTAGRNCRVIGQAKRVRLLVDGEAYFTAFVHAALQAEHELIVVGWDFHSRTRLTCEPVEPGVPTALGEFLNFLAKRRPALRIYVLVWDFPIVFGTEREFPIFYGIRWKPHRRIKLRYDDTHPTGASHHQKFVVVDGAIGFCGGIDLTFKRWDTCRHTADDAQRNSEGEPYPPFHDVMLMVEGDIAAHLRDTAAERWQRAGGRPFARFNPARTDLWPPAVPVDIESPDQEIPVGLSLTAPNDQNGIRDVEALYVDLILAARRLIYMENQYFTSKAIGDALADSLSAPSGPEVIVVVRKLSHGWLEAMTMETLRTALLRKLFDADRHKRLNVYFPHIDGLQEGTCIDVHSKLMIVDDDWLRVGSSNCANRSMGLDTECDLTVEARGRTDIQQFIRQSRLQLLAEHSGCSPQEVESATRNHSVAAALTTLYCAGRSLQRLEVPEVSTAAVAVAGIGDPEEPAFNSAGAGTATRNHGLERWQWLAGTLLTLAVLFALWRFTPLAAYTDPKQVVSWANELGSRGWVPWAVVMAFTPACLVLFPRSLITLFAVFAFGPWWGFGYAMTGILVAALVTYGVGMAMDHRTAKRLSGPRFARIVGVLKKHGLAAITALRLVPLAPFAVEGFVAGAFRLPLWSFMAGTAIGMLPGTLMATVFGDQITAALSRPRGMDYGILACGLILMAILTFAVKRWFSHAEAMHRAT